MIHPAGSKIDYTVTFLEMTERPAYDWPHLPANSHAALLRAENPPVWWFLSLYDAVGRDYEWVDMHRLSQDQLRRWLDDVWLYTLLEDGWPQGFFALDHQDDGIDLAYFGMVPEAVGKGLGSWLLKTAILTAWDQYPDALTVNTCTLDHPRALALYQKQGFTPVRQEPRTTVLTRDRDLTRIPK